MLLLKLLSRKREQNGYKSTEVMTGDALIVLNKHKERKNASDFIALVPLQIEMETEDTVVQ